MTSCPYHPDAELEDEEVEVFEDGQSVVATALVCPTCGIRVSQTQTADVTSK